MLCPHSWYSLLMYAHIGHKLVSWNCEQCCRRNFSFSFRKKINFQFPSAKNGAFCEARTKLPLSIRQNSTHSAGSGSNLNYMCIIVCSIFFEKIIFRYPSTYFICDTTMVLQDSTRSDE